MGRLAMIPFLVGITSVAASVLCACGASQEPKAESPAASTEQIAPEPGLPPLPPGHVWRVQVMRVMSPGLPALLARIEVQEKLTDDGKFIGWSVVRLKDPAFWQGVDLRPGDLIVRVNGRSVGHYDEAFKVWRSMVTAPELVVAYERGGQKRELRYVVHDEDPDGGAAAVPPASSAPAAPPPAPPPDAGASG